MRDKGLQSNKHSGLPFCLRAKLIPSHKGVLHTVTRASWTWITTVPVSWHLKVFNAQIHVPFQDPWHNHIPTCHWMSLHIVVVSSCLKFFVHRVFIWPKAIMTSTQIVRDQLPHFCLVLPKPAPLPGFL